MRLRSAYKEKAPAPPLWDPRPSLIAPPPTFLPLCQASLTVRLFVFVEKRSMARLKYFAQEHDTVTRYVNLLTQKIWELRKTASQNLRMS